MKDPPSTIKSSTPTLNPNNNCQVNNGKNESIQKSQPQQQEFQLKRAIGVVQGVALTIGAIVGSGIFISPKGIVENVGSVGLSLIIWVACGLMSTIQAVCYAELGTAFPSSGADYHYLHIAFGSIPSFLYIWSSVMIFIPCGLAIQAISCAQYIIGPLFSSCNNNDAANNQPSELVYRLLACCAIYIVILINCFSVHLATKIQCIFTFTKIVSLIVIITLGLNMLVQGKTENFKEPFKDSKISVGNIALSFFSGMFAYGGANYLPFITEEVKNPTKTIPRSIYISMAFVIIFYLLINTCYFTVLTPYEIINSDAVAVTFGTKTLEVFPWIISVFVAISTFGALFMNVMPSSRIIFVGARNGHLPQILSNIQITQLTPMPALIFMGLLSLIYLSISDIFTLLNYSGFMYAIVSIGVASAMLYLRWKQPNHPRPIKVSLFFPITYLILSIFLFVLPLYVAPIEAAIGCVITLSGLPIYYLFIYNNNINNNDNGGLKPLSSQKWLFQSLDSMTRFIQKLLVCIQPEETNNDLQKIFD